MLKPSFVQVLGFCSFIAISLIAVFSIYLTYFKIKDFNTIYNATNTILQKGGNPFSKFLLTFDSISWSSYQSLLRVLNDKMIDIMDLAPFSDSKFIEFLTERMPYLAKNENFLDAIIDGKLNEFLKTLDNGTKYQLFEVYNEYFHTLSRQSNQMQDFSKSFESLKKLNDSGIKNNDLVFSALASIAAIVAVVMFLSVIVSAVQKCAAVKGSKIEIAFTPIGVLSNAFVSCFSDEKEKVSNTLEVQKTAQNHQQNWYTNSAEM